MSFSYYDEYPYERSQHSQYICDCCDAMVKQHDIEKRSIVDLVYSIEITFGNLDERKKILDEKQKSLNNLRKLSNRDIAELNKHGELLAEYYEQLLNDMDTKRDYQDELKERVRRGKITENDIRQTSILIHQGVDYDEIEKMMPKNECIIS